MGLENTNAFLPLQISNVDSAGKSRKEINREKSKQEDVKGAEKCAVPCVLGTPSLSREVGPDNPLWFLPT